MTTDRTTLAAEAKRLADELRAQSHGWVEYRVQDPVTHAYCISFSLTGSDACANPEHSANEWLRAHRKEFPKGRFVHYEVARVEVRTRSDELMRESAAMLDALAQAPSAPAEPRMRTVTREPGTNVSFSLMKPEPITDTKKKTTAPAPASTLAPCPFCGDDAPSLDTDAQTGAHTIRCTHCGVTIGDYAGPSSAIRVWNRRAEAAEAKLADNWAAKYLREACERAEAAEADARRYRWLRDNRSVIHYGEDGKESSPAWADILDRQIDAAMRSQD